MNQLSALGSIPSPLPPTRRARYRLGPTALAAGVVCLGLACAGKPTEPAAPAVAVAPSESRTVPPPAPETARRLPPLVLEVTGPEHPQPGTTITVVAEIRRVAPDGSPVALSLVVPRGVRIVSGAEHAQVPNGELQRHQWVLAVDSIPAEDLRVVAEIRGRGQGVHAERRYRFGRPAPRLPDPQGGVAPVELGNGMQTRPVPID